MKPILYESTETLFQSNGLGILNDCITCHVVEERNGQYEAEFEYPINGVHYNDIIEGRIILISHDESGDLQPFDIYGHSKAINGVTKFYAHHISYRQNAITVKPFTATSLANTLTKIKSNSINTNPFNYSTDKTVATAFQLTEPKPLKSILGGEEGSLLDVYGTGEYEWDRFQVILHLHRGTDSGVVVRYGKNLTELQDDIDYSNSYNGIVPFWFGQNEPADGEEAVDTLVTLSEWVLYKSGSTYDGRDSVIPVDFSSDFERPPTEAELRTAATAYLNRGNPLLPTDTLTFDFVELSDTDEYSYLDLQQVNLCDTVRVVFDDIDAAMKVISVDWNVLSERYDSLTLGDAPTTYAEAITDRLAEIAQTANAGAKLAKLWATNALSIAGNTNQYFWFAGTGTDTGAHITEVPRETFLADPANGGGNLLARSNGIAARDGLTELATFGANGAQVGQSGSGHVEILPTGFDVYGGNGTVNLAHIGYESGTAEAGTAVAPYYTFGERASTTYGNYSTVMGKNSTASGYCSIAQGYNAVASGSDSYANGYYTIAQGFGQTAIGSYNVAQGTNTSRVSTDHAFIIGNGWNGTRSNAFTVDWDGNTVASGTVKGSGWDGNLHVVSGNVRLDLGKGLSTYDINNNLKDLVNTSSAGGINNYIFGQGGYYNSEGVTYYQGNSLYIQSKSGITMEGAITTNSTLSTGGNLYVTGSTAVDNAKGYNSYNANGNLRTLSFISATDNYYFGSGSYDNSEGATYLRGNAIYIQSKGSVSITAPNGISNSGTYNALYKTTTMSVSVAAGSSGTYISSTTYNIPAASQVSGYNLVAISGVQSASQNIDTFNFHVTSNTQISAGFARRATTSSAYNVTFFLLWLKATSA